MTKAEAVLSARPCAVVKGGMAFMTSLAALCRNPWKQSNSKVSASDNTHVVSGSFVCSHQFLYHIESQ